MCGIAGFVGWSLSLADSEMKLRAMCSAIVHRGPDDEGRFVASRVALGMRRLSIIDVANGRQPIANEDGSIHVVLNGEIYNHRELRAKLTNLGHRFATRSDTETIVHLYEEAGDALVDELRGMFSFALWDAQRQRLVVARDRVGIKPLYYWEHAGGVAFVSELRSLLAMPGFIARVNPKAIAAYLAFGYVPETACILEGVRKLPPGHQLTWDRDLGVSVKRYWTPVRETREWAEEDAVSELRRLLNESVELHLESDVPLGAFLSGGIDSSTVVALMARHARRPVRTFSIGFDDPAFDEAPHAARVARELGTLHTELIVSPNADTLIEHVVRAFDEPFADSSALPTFLVSQLAREHVTVALSGDGGDELFGGYERYAEVTQLGQLGSAGLRSAIGGVVRRMPHVSPGRNYLLDWSRTKQARYTARVTLPLLRSEGGAARAEVAALLESRDSLLDDSFAAAGSRDFLTQMMLVDLGTYLPGDILTKVDRASMAHSLEARVPLLDHRLIEFAVSLPSSFKLRHGTGKWILRQAINGLVPSSVLEHPKQGFAVPLRRWFRKELRHRVDALLRENCAIHEFVNPRDVRHLVLEHTVGRRDHSAAIWRLMTLELWLSLLARGDLARPFSLGDAPALTRAARAG